MEISVGVVGLMAAFVLFPVAFYRYLQRLPDAPSCPTCRTVTRQLEPSGLALYLLAVLPVTVLGECTRCGWKGRMRLRWATRSAPGRR